MSPQPRPFRLRIHLLALAACVCLLTGVLVPARSYADELEPIQSENAWSHGSRSFSGLTTDVSGNLQRVEYTDDGLIVETYNYDGSYKLMKQQVIDSSTYTPSTLREGNTVIWGGFFGGSNANFVVTGQYNPDQDNTLPVVRVTKYSKDWNYLANCEYKYIHTVLPFDSGNCSMAEISGKLYIRTSHLNYTSLEDGVRHQSSMSFIVNESDMKSINNETYFGANYVSHSFDQRLAVLHSSVYSSDLGDAHPRAVVIQNVTSPNDTGVPESDGINVVEIKGNVGDNFNDTTVGGIATSEACNTVLTVGTQRDQNKVYTANGNISRYPYNVWLTVTDADLHKSNRIELTNYPENSADNATIPQIVKVTDNEFLILWGISPIKSDSLGDGRTHTVAYLFVNGNGTVIQGIQTFDGRLSDCQPVVMNGRIIWYATGLYQHDNHYNGGSQIPVFYTIDIPTRTVVPTGDESKLANATITLAGYLISSGKAVYTGAPITPEVTIRYGGFKLTEGVDYNIEFSNNVSTGVGAITITGLGKYYGQTITKYFMIDKKDINDCEKICYASDSDDHFYTGKPHSVYYRMTNCGYDRNGDATPTTYLKEGTDYTATYTNNVNVGTASYTFIGKGNYTGKIENTFEIHKAKLSDDNVWINSAQYTGGPIIPDINLYGNKLDPSEYTITCTNNINAGTATATITGTGKNVEGTLVKDFIIGQGDLYYAKIAPIPDQIYTGSRVKPSITVTLDGKTLIAGTDYELEYDDNIIVGGQASVTAKGINNYTGWTTGYFNIVRGSSGPSSGDSQPSEDSSRGFDAPRDAPSTSGDTPTSHGDGNSFVMWRLYNPNSGEHFYTQSNSERDNVIGAGWTFEGEGWHAPTSGDPVYRLYNSRGGEHHYTLSASERDSLVAAGWSYEGIGWYSDRDHSVPLYREYNPNQFSCNHNYTASRSEHDHLVSLGWRDEGVGWYGI